MHRAMARTFEREVVALAPITNAVQEVQSVKEL
jgi:hypothetical protein